MQKIVIDTNVIVSALIQRSYPHLIIGQLLIEQKVQLCTSLQLMNEYYEVLARPKFSRYPEFITQAARLLLEIEKQAIKYEPKIKLTLITDKDDNMIVELADECIADFIITGNTNDFTFPTYKNTQIVTPKTYWEKHKP